MVFSSLPFLCVFLPAVLLLYLAIPSQKAGNALLIISSLLFYAYGEPIYVFLMVASTLANYAFALIIDKDGLKETRKKIWMIAAVGSNLGMLGVFKYSGMAITTANAIAGLAIPVPQIVLPIGISFYTFQALSYVVDVYRGEVKAQHNYFYVLLYISFFPQLIAGPIIKYHDIEQQIAVRSTDAGRIARGFRRFIVGLAKKVLIADTIAVAVDALYANGGDFSTVGAWIAAVGYILQIYYDFSGYSDMAIGLGCMFGFDFKENFDHPYRSASIREFWRRWHISLSTWFKEYLYIPLGGNRKGRARTYLNKVIVFALCGLWHGASWTFVVWGLYHGLFLLFEEVVPVRKLPRPIGVAYALLVVTIGFVIFRSDTLGQAACVISAMFGFGSASAAAVAIAFSQLSPLFLATFFVGLAGLCPIKEGIVAISDKVHLMRARSVGAYACTMILLVACILTLSSGAYDLFIHFRF